MVVTPGTGAKFWSVREAFPPATLFGFILMVTGAELFNVAALYTEFTVFLVSSAAYTAGYLFGVGFWLWDGPSGRLATVFERVERAAGLSYRAFLVFLFYNIPTDLDTEPGGRPVYGDPLGIIIAGIAVFTILLVIGVYGERLYQTAGMAAAGIYPYYVGLFGLTLAFLWVERRAQ